MKSTPLISIGILGILLCTPTLVSAQSSGVNGSIDIQITSTVSSTTTGVVAVPTKKQTPKEIPIKKIISPRDVLSGQATGRTSASGTKTLSEKLEGQIEKRNDAMERNASTTEARHEEAMERKAEKRGEISRRISAQMITRMNAAIERYDTLINRVDSRIAKLKEKNVNTSNAEANIVIARAKIAEAKVAVMLAKNGDTDAVASSTEPVDERKIIRDSLQNARIAVEAAHKALIEAIVSLRANVKLGDGTATTTASSTVQ